MLVVAVKSLLKALVSSGPATNQSSYLYSIFQLDHPFKRITNHNQIKAMVVQMFFYDLFFNKKKAVSPVNDVAGNYRIWTSRNSAC